jgi:DNA-binding transcriptional ArsR family regulator
MPRPTAPRIDEVPAGPRVRDFTSARVPSVRVDFDVRTVYDFVFSLGEDAGETDDLPGDDRAWLAQAKAALDQVRAHPAGGEMRHVAIRLAALAVDRPEIPRAADLVRLVETMPAPAVVRAVFAEDLREPATGALAERALAGDPAAIDELLAHDLEMPSEGDGFLTSLLRDPAVALGEIRSLLAAWLPLFQPIEGRLLAMLERDVALRAVDRRTLSPAELIEATTGGIRWPGEVGVARVILAPSYFNRPYNYILGGGDWRLYGYPIADSALDTVDPLAPPQTVVRLHRALGDDTRLRILRLLRDRDLYLTEIAGLLDLSKPTIKHHLALLRSAGLVTVTDEGGMTYYTLRRDRLDAASTELKRFLLG